MMTTRTTPTWRIALVALVGSLAVLATGVDSAGAAAPAPSPQAASALAWQAAQLAANGGSMPGFTAGSVDWGLTADAVLAYVAAGAADDPAAIAATDLLVADVDAFTTWEPDQSGVRIVGTTAKLLLVLEGMGRSTTVDGVDLSAEVRSLMATDGPAAGRFTDRVPDPTFDASNGFGQAMAMLALAPTADGVPAPAATFLLEQQCPAGGFRLNYLGTAGCDTDDAADSDATAVAVQALLASPRSTAVTDALGRAVGWLISRQDASGGFGGTGPTAALNANSTGVIAQALRAAGSTAAADKAATWIVSQAQIAATSAAGTPAAADVGAIGYNAAARDAALRGGIRAQAADQWRRTTAQGVLALGLSPYGPVDVDPIDDSTIKVPSTTVPAAAAPTPTPPVTDPAPTTTAAVPTAVDGLDSGASEAPELATTSGASQSTDPAVGAELAFSGSTNDQLLLIGMALLLAGMGALALSGRRSVEAIRVERRP